MSIELYFDHAAGTDLEPAAIGAMHAAAEQGGAHPSAVHRRGRRARAALERARGQVAAYLQCGVDEVWWSHGGTDAVTRALELATAQREGPVVVGALEHPAVRDAVARLAQRGREVVVVPAADGQLDPQALARALPRAAVVCLAPLNHELGTVLPWARLQALAREAWWVVDAAQAAAWMEPAPWMTSQAMVTCAAAKLGGPAGVGALRVPRTVRCGAQAEPSGTPPWLAAIGMGAACEARAPRRGAARERVVMVAQRLLDGLRAVSPGLLHNGEAAWLGPIVNVAVPGIDGKALQAQLDLRGVCVARTSACRQTVDDGSAIVAAAYPQEPARARSCLRLSLGWSTNNAQVDAVVEAWRDSLRQLAGDAVNQDPGSFGSSAAPLDEPG
ncbi:MAG: aminotransferase class V-fold PLP-dependent enzyme [Deltaproteobacteria bacterium]|nr:aminotransferase class V-fold PLP-dependent enzyme [Deltaproteobacteria bacterium]